MITCRRRPGPLRWLGPCVADHLAAPTSPPPVGRWSRSTSTKRSLSPSDFSRSSASTCGHGRAADGSAPRSTADLAIRPSLPETLALKPCLSRRPVGVIRTVLDWGSNARRAGDVEPNALGALAANFSSSLVSQKWSWRDPGSAVSGVATRGDWIGPCWPSAGSGLISLGS